MKLFIFVALSLIASVDPSLIKKINETKEAAEEAFKGGNYTAAIRHYKTLVDSLGVNEDAVLLNLANAYYLAKDTANAFTQYQAVSESPEKLIRSKAHQQLGIMANKQGRAEEALSHFKQAIKAAPTNDDARYNYELLKKKLDEQKKQQEQQQQNKDQQNKDQQKQDQQNQDQQNKDQQNQDQKDKEQQENDQKNQDEQNKEQQQNEQEQEDQDQKQQEQQQKEQEEKEKQEEDARKDKMPNLDREKLEQMKISEEKARMILEAMKNQEKQYLQQQRRKATQPKDSDKPDW